MAWKGEILEYISFCVQCRSEYCRHYPLLVDVADKYRTMQVRPVRRILHRSGDVFEKATHMGDRIHYEGFLGVGRIDYEGLVEVRYAN